MKSTIASEAVAVPLVEFNNNTPSYESKEHIYNNSRTKKIILFLSVSSLVLFVSLVSILGLYLTREPSDNNDVCLMSSCIATGMLYSFRQLFCQL